MASHRRGVGQRLPRWLISGYYGAGNLGDEALLAGLLLALRRWPVEPWVASLNPTASAHEHQVNAVHRLRGLPRALLQSDALISGGGGLLQDTTSRRSLRYYLGVIQAAKALRKPVAVFAQSLGPLTEAGAQRVRRALQGVPLGLRDQPSLDLAEALGLRAVSVADTALLLPAPVPALDSTADEATLVLIPRAGYPAMGLLLAALGARHQQAGGRLRIVLLHPQADAREGERLAQALPLAERPAIARVDALQAALQGVRAVVSGRLHGLILAAALGTPVAGLAYDPKVSGFAHDIGAPVFSLAGGFATAPDPAVLAALEAFVATPHLDRAALARVRARASAGVRWLCEEALQRPPAHSA